MINSPFSRGLRVALIALATAAATKSGAQTVYPPCCRTTAVDAASGVVTAIRLGTGATFKFKFDSGVLPSTVKVDQWVWGNEVRVSMTGYPGCCTVLPASTDPAQPGTRASRGYETAYSAESTSHVRGCDQVAQRSFPQGGHKCIPKSTMIASGKNPDGSRATYSWTCTCS